MRPSSPRPPQQQIQIRPCPNAQALAATKSVGTATTECATPGNVQINATAPDVPTYAYPWDDEFYGPALIMGGGAWGNHGMGRRAVAAATASPPAISTFFLAHRGGQT